MVSFSAFKRQREEGGGTIDISFVVCGCVRVAKDDGTRDRRSKWAMPSYGYGSIKRSASGTGEGRNSRR
ncbi:hypothetical protein M0802_010878 [Mischocyttarus mexicanus]|nr:hypothetical protein M0802_010878 [Mischocyttarus mexicanus]